jgi:predicted dehydrogenase
MNTFKWGIVGTGHAANQFARDLYFLDNHVVHSVSSRSIDNAKDFASKYNAKSFFGTHDDIFNDKEIDAVYIASDSALHKDLSIKALNKQIPVLCEKPFAMSLLEAEEIISVSLKNKTLFMEAMWMLYLPIIKQIINDLKSNKIGNLLNINLSYGRHFVKDKDFRLFNKEKGGGSLYDFGIYPISFLSSLIDSTDLVYAQGKMNEFGTDDYANVLIKSNQISALFSCSMVNNLSNNLIISGSLGKIIVDAPFFNPKKYTIYDNENNIIGGLEVKYKGSGLREQASYFEQMLKENKIESDIQSFSKMILEMSILQDISNQINLNTNIC